MTRERFNELLDQLEGTSLETLKSKNVKYAPCDDALHNFHVGARLDGSTTAQTIWHYMKKHMVALLDKIERDDWADKEDVHEKIQDIMNYLRFIWVAANEATDSISDGNDEDEYADIEDNLCPFNENCKDGPCLVEERSCSCCKHMKDGAEEVLDPTGAVVLGYCANCKNNFLTTSEEYEKAPFKWEHENE